MRLGLYTDGVYYGVAIGFVLSSSALWDYRLVACALSSAFTLYPN